jgi:general secretion pathway protein A
MQPTAITSTRASVYPKYFGLKEPSFSIAPDPHYLFLSEQHKEALAHLLYGAGESGGFVLLTGEVGTGKTTVCRAFLEQLPEGVEVALILNPAVTANELLLNLCDEFRIEVPEGERSVKNLVDRLNRYLLDAHAKGRRPVLIIDEAQNLRPKVLEQVRLLTNLETSKHKLLQIFLIGQPELRRMLERDALRQINQRITARFHLRPFTLQETGDYIRHRVAVAGVDRPLFTAAAIREIYKSSGGVPRLVNILCDRALLGACVTRGSQVTPAIVKTAAREVHGERIEPLPRPAVRPGFAIAAALTLILTAGWLGYTRMSDDAEMLLADLLPADRKLLTWRPASSGDGEDAVQDPPSGSLAVSAVSSDAASEGDLDAASDAESDAASSLGSDADEPLNGPPPTEAPVDAASGDASGSGDAVPVGALPRIDPASFEPSAVAETIERLSLPEPDAMRLLLLRWGIEADELPSDDPCAGVGSFGLQCERGLGGLSEIRRFDRPALLQVRGAEGVPRYIVLSALDASLGTLDVSSGSELAPVEGIESILTGDYILLWKLPLDGSTLIGFGAVGDVVVWLRRTLAQVPASGLPASDSRFYDLDLTRAVQAFQASRGLAADGIVGPHTVIQLHNAIDLPGIPRLNPPPETPEPASTEPAAS